MAKLNKVSLVCRFNVRMKVKANAQWKSIPLSQNFFTNIESAPALCGGIEELTDYTLVTKGKKSGKVLKRPLSCPKKATITAEDLKDTDEPPPKKLAKKNVFKVVEAENVTPSSDKTKSKKEKKKKSKGSEKPIINLDALNIVKTSDRVQSASTVVKKPTTNANATQKEPDSDNSTPLKIIKGTDAKPSKDSKIKKDKVKGAMKEAKASASVPVSEMKEWRELFVCEEIIQVGTLVMLIKETIDWIISRCWQRRGSGAPPPSRGCPSRPRSRAGWTLWARRRLARAKHWPSGSRSSRASSGIGGGRTRRRRRVTRMLLRLMMGMMESRRQL